LANAAILSSSRAIPQRLIKIGYNFAFHIQDQSYYIPSEKYPMMF